MLDESLLKRISPRVRVAYDHWAEADWHLARRAIFDYELLYVDQGHLEVVIDERVYHAQPGDFVLFKPGVEHSMTGISEPDENSTRVLHLPHTHFDLVVRSSHHEVYTSFKPLSDFCEEEICMISPDLTELPDFSIPDFIRLGDPMPVKELLMKIIAERERSAFGHSHIENGYLLVILGLLLRSVNLLSDPQVELNFSRLMKVRDHILRNFRVSMNIDHLVTISGLSKYYFLRLFKKAFGLSPITFQRRCQIEKAKELLLYTDMTITEIGEEVGYDSIHAFSRAFKQVVGVSPMHYIMLHRSRKR
jgi:AraC-like DNA-binding protein